MLPILRLPSLVLICPQSSLLQCMWGKVGLGPANPRNESMFLEVACHGLARHIRKVCLSQLSAIGHFGLCKESGCMSHVMVFQLAWTANLGSLEVGIT